MIFLSTRNGREKKLPVYPAQALRLTVGQASSSVRVASILALLRMSSGSNEEHACPVSTSTPWLRLEQITPTLPTTRCYLCRSKGCMTAKNIFFLEILDAFAHVERYYNGCFTAVDYVAMEHRAKFAEHKAPFQLHQSTEMLGLVMNA